MAIRVVVLGASASPPEIATGVSVEFEPVRIVPTTVCVEGRRDDWFRDRISAVRVASSGRRRLLGVG